MIPRSLVIPLCYNPMEDPLSYCEYGGFGYVWKGKHDGKEVAAKVLRVYSTCDLEEVQQVKKVKKVGSRLVMCINN